MKKKVIILEAELVGAWKNKNKWNNNPIIRDCYDYGINSFRLRNIMKSWQLYKQEHLNLSMDLYFEFWRGSNIFRVDNTEQYYVFSEKELLTIKQEIDELINSNQIFGLILNLRLTQEEMEKWSYNSYNLIGKSFVELFQYFYKRIPTYYLQQALDCDWMLYDYEFLQEIYHFYINQGYLTDKKGHWIYVDKLFEFNMDDFFGCCLNHFSRMQEEKLELSLIKKD